MGIFRGGIFFGSVDTDGEGGELIGASFLVCLLKTGLKGGVLVGYFFKVLILGISRVGGVSKKTFQKGGNQQISPANNIYSLEV